MTAKDENTKGGNVKRMKQERQRQRKGTDLSSENLPNDPTRDNDDGLDNDDDENGLERRQSRTNGTPHPVHCLLYF